MRGPAVTEFAMPMRPRLLSSLLALLLPVTSPAQNKDKAPEANYDEAKIPDYELPDPLVFEDGRAVKAAEDWRARRAEILGLFEEHVYGRAVGSDKALSSEVRKEVDGFLGGRAFLREVRLWFEKPGDGPHMDVLMILPNPARKKPVPAFLTLNFSGNHSIHPSPEISLPVSYMRAGRDDARTGRVVKDRATEKGRGFKASRWAVERIIDAGCGLVTLYYGDIDPDFDDGFENGVHALFEKPGPGEWGSIATWAWGLSRVLDHMLETDLFDPDRIAVMGHSRLGKTALWAGATDDRFALVISNNSGCGGAALNRRAIGERVGRINRSFPHWFCDRFNDYNENEGALPVDQHQLVALIAPRRVYIASAAEDRWADPKGEFLSAAHADPVYALFGKTGVGVAEQPPLDTPVGEEVRYHVRSGGHDVKDFDWEQYIKALLAAADDG